MFQEHMEAFALPPSEDDLLLNEDFELPFLSSDQPDHNYSDPDEGNQRVLLIDLSDLDNKEIAVRQLVWHIGGAVLKRVISRCRCKRYSYIHSFN